MFSKYSFSWYNSFIVTKVLGTFASECYTERKFLEPSLPRNDSSTGAKVPRSECSMERKFHESKILSGVFSLPGTKVQRNEKAWNRLGKCTATFCQLRCELDRMRSALYQSRCAFDEAALPLLVKGKKYEKTTKCVRRWKFWDGWDIRQG